MVLRPKQQRRGHIVQLGRLHAGQTVSISLKITNHCQRLMKMELASERLLPSV